jgi:hypothetical protein
VIDPVARVDVKSAWSNLFDGRYVYVARENEIDLGAAFQLGHRPSPQFDRSIRFRQPRRPVLILRSRNDRGDPRAYVRVKYPEKSDAEWISNDLFQEPIAKITLPQSVPVHDEGVPIADSYCGTFLQDLYADLVAEKGATPRVVVAADKSDRNTRVAHLGESRKHPEMLCLDDTSILEPEVEEIAVYQQLRRALTHVLEKLPEGALRGRRYSAEMNVGYDVGWLLVHCGGKLPASPATDNGPRYAAATSGDL